MLKYIFFTIVIRAFFGYDDKKRFLRYFGGNMEFRFENKVALITGAASGMGFLSAKCIAEEGGCVVLCDINAEGLARAEAEIGIPERTLSVTVDATDYAQVVAARDAAVARFSRIDILICCAGGAETRLFADKVPAGCTKFHEVPIEVYDMGIDLNLKGAFYFDHAVMAQMAAQKGGVIINLGSVTGAEGCARNVAYSATKSALMNGVVKSLALAGAEYGVRACCVAPGPVLTRPGMAGMKTLQGRAAETQEIVDMILYLASDKAACITGTTFLCDCGRDILKNKE